MKFGSLFAGIGGMDLGFERAGMECCWQVEIDEYASKVLAKHWPAVRRYRDVRDVGRHNLEPVDLICGGFPCQPFSSASRGRRVGTADDRWLWPEMLRVVTDLRPTWIVVENVTHFDGAGLETLVLDLEAIKYEVGPPFEIPACAFGFDHRRARLWIISYTDSNSESRLPINAEVAGVSGGNSIAGRVGTKDGVSNRLDRLRGLGNAVVPQVAEWIGERIREVWQHDRRELGQDRNAEK